MRLVKVNAPEQNVESIRQDAFAAGIASVSVQTVQKHSSDGSVEPASSLEAETSTPKAKRFIQKVLAADYYDAEKISIVVRQPRSVISSEPTGSLTMPLEEPGADLYEELWQFTHITYGLIGRVLIASLLLTYGLIGQKLLLIIAGLLFLPLLPMLMAVGFGVVSGQWKLALNGIAAFAVAMVLLAAGGAVVASLSDPPMRYNEFSSFPVSLALSAVVGVAAGLASIDDAGRRELIGLAAAAQIGILPAWLGAAAVLGPPPTADAGDVMKHATTLGINSLAIVVAAALVHAATGVTKNVGRIPTV